MCFGTFLKSIIIFHVIKSQNVNPLRQLSDDYEFHDKSSFFKAHSLPSKNSQPFFLFNSILACKKEFVEEDFPVFHLFLALAFLSTCTAHERERWDISLIDFYIFSYICSLYQGNQTHACFSYFCCCYCSNWGWREREREVGWRSKNIKFPCRRTEKFKRLNRMSIK